MKIKAPTTTTNSFKEEESKIKHTTFYPNWLKLYWCKNPCL